MIFHWIPKKLLHLHLIPKVKKVKNLLLLLHHCTFPMHKPRVHSISRWWIQHLKEEDCNSLLEKVMSRNERNTGQHQHHLIFKGPMQWNYNECITFHAFLRNDHVSVTTGKFVALQDFNVLKDILSGCSIYSVLIVKNSDKWI